MLWKCCYVYFCCCCCFLSLFNHSENWLSPPLGQRQGWVWPSMCHLALTVARWWCTFNWLRMLQLTKVKQLSVTLLEPEREDSARGNDNSWKPFARNQGNWRCDSVARAALAGDPGLVPNNHCGNSQLQLLGIQHPLLASVGTELVNGALTCT